MTLNHGPPGQARRSRVGLVLSEELLSLFWRLGPALQQEAPHLHVPLTQHMIAQLDHVGI